MYDEDDDGDGHMEGTNGVAAGQPAVSDAPYGSSQVAVDVKEWESEGLSLVMETEEEEEEEEEGQDDKERKGSGIGIHRAALEADDGLTEPRMRRSILQGKAWRPSDVHVA